MATQDPAQIRALQTLSNVHDDGYRSPYELAQTSATLKAIVRRGWASSRLRRRTCRFRGDREFKDTVPCYRITDLGRKHLAEFYRLKANPEPKPKPKFSKGRAPAAAGGHPWSLGGRRV